MTLEDDPIGIPQNGWLFINNGKPDFLMDDLGRKHHYFRNIHIYDLGGGCTYFFIFTIPKIGEDEAILTSIYMAVSLNGGFPPFHTPSHDHFS